MVRPAKKRKRTVLLGLMGGRPEAYRSAGPGDGGPRTVGSATAADFYSADEATCFGGERGRGRPACSGATPHLSGSPHASLRASLGSLRPIGIVRLPHPCRQALALWPLCRAPTRLACCGSGAPSCRRTGTDLAASTRPDCPPLPATMPRPAPAESAGAISERPCRGGGALVRPWRAVRLCSCAQVPILGRLGA
jgi:hypothetical protein